MSVVEQAVEVGARALFDEERNESMGDDRWPEFDSDENVGRPIYKEHARASLVAAWPILSALLRGLHVRSPHQRWYGFPRADKREFYCTHDNRSWPCPDMALILQTDKELGL